MTPFFQNAAALEALRQEAHSWLDTPFRQGCRVKGPHGGVDCVAFALACFEAAGVVQPGEVTIPEYNLTQYETGETFPLVEWFRQEWIGRRAVRFDREEPLESGDVCFVRYRKGVHHLALWIDGYVWHTMVGQRVLNLKPASIAKHGGALTSRFRPIAPETTAPRST